MTWPFGSTEDDEREQAKEDYENGQKEGSQATTLGRILGPGFVSEAYQAGFVNGADNPAKDDD